MAKNLTPHLNNRFFLYRLGLGPYLFIACWCLFIFGIMAIIFSSTGNNVLYTGKKLKKFIPSKKNKYNAYYISKNFISIMILILLIFTVYSSLMALLFSMFLVYDTQRIMGGKKHSISPEEHIFASITIYIDVVYIFLAILGIGGRD